MNATLLLKRDSGFVDYVRRYKVLLDGEEIGLIKNGGSFAQEIPPGPHTLQMKVDWCSSNAVAFYAEAGASMHFECGSNFRGRNIVNVSRAMWEAPDEWIWLRASPCAADSDGGAS